MLEPRLPTEDDLIKAYAVLGISPDKRSEMLAEANAVRQSVFPEGGIPVFVELDMDAAAMQLAASGYIAGRCRMPLVADAAKGGAFTAAVTHLLLKKAVLRKQLQHTDIRHVADILIATGKAFGQAYPGYSLLKELACVGTLCSQMNGFDPDAKLKRMFGKAGKDFGEFTKFVEDYSLRSELMHWLKHSPTETPRA